MKITDFGLLDYLHDASVLSITYDTSRKENRQVVIAIKCHPDAGFPAWNGKDLCIRLDDIVLVSFFAFGAVLGQESVDSWGHNLSEKVDAELRRLQECGINCDGVRFSVCFHSGSVLEGLCKSIAVDVW